MKEEHRLLVAFLLSILIILIYGKYYQKKYPVKNVPAPISQKKVLEEKVVEESDIQLLTKMIGERNALLIGRIMGYELNNNQNGEHNQI